MARFCADLPPDLQRYLLSLSLDGLAAFALTSRVSCMRAAEALRTAITWKDIWSDKERKKSTRRACRLQLLGSWRPHRRFTGYSKGVSG